MGSPSQGPQELGAFSCGDMRAMRSHSLGDEAALLGLVLSQQAAPEIWKEQPSFLTLWSISSPHGACLEMPVVDVQ